MKLLKNYKVFVDLDGVLADFDKKVEELLGHRPDRTQPHAEPAMWKAIEKYRTFYRDLEMMSDAPLLLSYLNLTSTSFTILTGISRTTGCAEQKREWCFSHVGPEVPVITCASKDKAREAWKVTPTTHVPLLIDDWTKYKSVWEESGGEFVVHTSAQDTVHRLRLLGVGL